MASFEQEELAQYYQGLANQAEDQAKTLAGAETAGIAEQKRLQDTLDRLQRQRQLAITNADRELIDNSIRVQTNNLAKANSTIAQIQQERTTLLSQVTANQNLAKEAVKGPPAAQNIPDPSVRPPPPLPSPSVVQVNPTAQPLTDQEIAATYGVTDPKERGAIRGTDIITDEARVAFSDPETIRRQEELNRQVAANPAVIPRVVNVADSTISIPDSDVVDTPPPVSRSAIEQGGEIEARIAPRPPSPPEDFVYEEDGSLIPSDSSRAAERREEIAAEEQRERFDKIPPAQDFVIDPNTGELVPGNSEQARAILEEERRQEFANIQPAADFVIDPNTGELVPGDSEQARAILEEEELNKERERYAAIPPGQDFVTDPITGELVPGDSDRAAEIRAEEEADAERARAAEPQPRNVSAAFDSETQTWGVWDNDEGAFIVTGLTEQEAQLQAEEIAAGFGVQDRPEFPRPPPPPVQNLFSAAFDPETQTWGVWDNTQGIFVDTGFFSEEDAQRAADELGLDAEDAAAFAAAQEAEDAAAQAAEDEAAAEQAALEAARAQAAISERRRQANQGDWRVKLGLAPFARYLYKAPNPGILQPLAVTDGVVFPYTPKIDLSYRAMYDVASLTHTNYNNYFFKGSMLDPVNLTATFTAQDTSEANYLLAVIHFFRSVTKMFYGQDAERGAPPPLVFLTGLGEYQFSEHPCVVHQFNYSLPADVDYIRARSVMDPGVDLQNRRDRQDVPTNPVSSAVQRLKGLFPKVEPGAEPAPPPPPTLGKDGPTYVPTRMDISIILYPVATRAQVSQQFSLAQYANGDLLKGGFW
jgi:hypothetical protein